MPEAASSNRDKRSDKRSVATADLNAGVTRPHDDAALLSAIRASGSATITDLTERLAITATAVRQRLERAASIRHIEREKIIGGRGRPSYRYRLTVAGQRAAGAKTSDLADALWHEVKDIADADIRERVLAGVARRLGKIYADEIDRDSPADVSQRIERLRESVSARNFSIKHDPSHHGDAIVVEAVTAGDHPGGLPVLSVGQCPYPTLTDDDPDRSMCRMEERVFSEALGQPVALSSCRLDGDQTCQFTAIPSHADESSRHTKSPQDSSRVQ